MRSAFTIVAGVIAEELPIFLVIFTIPVAAGVALWWKVRV